MHSSLSTRALPCFTRMAYVGQTRMQARQPSQRRFVDAEAVRVLSHARPA